MTCERIGVAVVVMEVPHAHVHLVPIDGIYDIDFSKPRLKMSQEELEVTTQRIADAVEA